MSGGSIDQVGRWLWISVVLGVAGSSPRDVAVAGCCCARVARNICVKEIALCGSQLSCPSESRAAPRQCWSSWYANDSSATVFDGAVIECEGELEGFVVLQFRAFSSCRFEYKYQCTGQQYFVDYSSIIRLRSMGMMRRCKPQLLHLATQHAGVLR